MQRRLSKIPLSKEELLLYLRKKKSNIEKIDLHQFCGHTFFGGIKELIEDVNEFKRKKQRCRQISELCRNTQGDLPDVLRKFDMKINKERLRTGEFIKTYDIVKDLEFCTPSAFTLLY